MTTIESNKLIATSCGTKIWAVRDISTGEVDYWELEDTEELKRLDLCPDIYHPDQDMNQLIEAIEVIDVDVVVYKKKRWIHEDGSETEGYNVIVSNHKKKQFREGDFIDPSLKAALYQALVNYCKKP